MQSSRIQLLAFMAAGMMLSQSPSFAALEKGWVLHQRSLAVGDTSCYVTSKSLKVTNDKNGFTIVTRAPQWRLSAFNKDTRRIYETTLPAFVHDFNLANKHNSIKAIALGKWSAKKPKDWKGLAALECEQVRGGKHLGSLLTLKNSELPEEISAVFSKFYQIPKSDKMVLRMTALLPSKKFNGLFYSYGDKEAFPKAFPEQVVTWLDTMTCKQSDIPASTFDVPKGYRSTGHIAEVWVDMDGLKNTIMNEAKDALLGD